LQLQKKLHQCSRINIAETALRTGRGAGLRPASAIEQGSRNRKPASIPDTLAVVAPMLDRQRDALARPVIWLVKTSVFSAPSALFARNPLRSLREILCDLCARRSAPFARN